MSVKNLRNRLVERGEILFEMPRQPFTRKSVTHCLNIRDNELKIYDDGKQSDLGDK